MAIRTGSGKSRHRLAAKADGCRLDDDKGAV